MRFLTPLRSVRSPHCACRVRKFPPCTATCRARRRYRRAVAGTRRSVAARSPQRSRWSRAGAAAARHLRIRRVQDHGHQPRLRREGCVRPVVERQAWYRSAIGGHGVAHPVGDGLPATRDLLHGAIHAHRRRRRRQDPRAVPHRPCAVAIDRRVVVAGQSLHGRDAISRADRRAARPEQLGPENHEQPHL